MSNFAPSTDDRCTRRGGRDGHDTDEVLDAIEALPWVLSVCLTDRDDATHAVQTDLTALRVDHELHTLRNLGARCCVFSQAGHYGLKIYVSL